jgi:hypothetical protein
VSDAIKAIDGIVAQRALEIHQLARGTAKRDAFRADECNPGGIVAAVLHASKPLEEDRHDRL